MIEEQIELAMEASLGTNRDEGLRRRCADSRTSVEDDAEPANSGEAAGPCQSGADHDRG